MFEVRIVVLFQPFSNFSGASCHRDSAKVYMLRHFLFYKYLLQGSDFFRRVCSLYSAHHTFCMMVLFSYILAVFTISNASSFMFDSDNFRRFFIFCLQEPLISLLAKFSESKKALIAIFYNGLFTFSSMYAHWKSLIISILLR